MCLSVTAVFVFTYCCLSEIDQLKVKIDQLESVIPVSVRESSWLWVSASELCEMCEVVDVEADAEDVKACLMCWTDWVMMWEMCCWVICVCDCACVC